MNCWNLNEYEPAAMWNLYLKSSEGVAIQTTFDKIKKSLEACEEGIIVGKVDYIDHIKEYKRGYFQSCRTCLYFA
ncbi:hypothetical protein ACU80C_31965 (plasmid) [Bacillus mycoides]